MIYRGKTGKVYETIEPHLAAGGEGKIFVVSGNESIVLKIYKKTSRTKQQEEKILYMLTCQLNNEQLDQVIWPLDIVYEEGEFAGFVMSRLADTKNLSLLFLSDEYPLNIKERIYLAYNLCAAVETVHSIGQVCGDLNPQNFCVHVDKKSKKYMQVSMVDTDSWHISDEKEQKVWRCGVGLPEYLAPEIQKKLMMGYNLRDADLPTYSFYTDYFALAIHIFRLFMNGCHPFNCARDTSGGIKNQYDRLQGVGRSSVATPQAMDNIADGYFPFCMQRSGFCQPIFAPSIEVFPHFFTMLFVRGFIDGNIRAEVRPTAREWMEALEKLMEPGVLVVCDKNHWHSAETGDNCPWCEMEKKMSLQLKQPHRESEEEDNTVDAEFIQESFKSNSQYISEKVETKSSKTFFQKLCGVFFDVVRFAIFFAIFFVIRNGSIYDVPSFFDRNNESNVQSNDSYTDESLLSFDEMKAYMNTVYWGGLNDDDPVEGYVSFSEDMEMGCFCIFYYDDESSQDIIKCAYGPIEKNDGVYQFHTDEVNFVFLVEEGGEGCKYYLKTKEVGKIPLYNVSEKEDEKERMYKIMSRAFSRKEE